MWHWTRVLLLKELHMFLVEVWKMAVQWCRKTMCGTRCSCVNECGLWYVAFEELIWNASVRNEKFLRLNTVDRSGFSLVCTFIALVTLLMKPCVQNRRQFISHVCQNRIEWQVHLRSSATLYCENSLRASFVCLVVFSLPFFLHLKAQFVSSHSHTGSDCSREMNLLIVFAVAPFLACSAACLNISAVFECADGCFAFLFFSIFFKLIFFPSNCEQSHYTFHAQVSQQILLCISFFFHLYLFSCVFPVSIFWSLYFGVFTSLLKKMFYERPILFKLCSKNVQFFLLLLSFNCE